MLDFTQAEASQIAQIMKSKTGAKEFPVRDSSHHYLYTNLTWTLRTQQIFEIIHKPFQEKGIHVGKSKYMFVRDVYGDGRVILGKKKDLGGITLAATKTGNCR